LASHWFWHAAAVVIPVGLESGCWLPLPAGALPHVLRTWIGEPETVARRAEAAMMVVKACILIEFDVIRMLMMIETKNPKDSKKLQEGNGRKFEEWKDE
jgi:hypothetical protein